MNDTRTVDLSGELTIQTAAVEFSRLFAAVEKNATVSVGLAGVTEMDTAGLQLLLAVRREARRLGGGAEFHDVSDAIREALAVVHLDDQLRPIGGGR